jgi:hypothetical protein
VHTVQIDWVDRGSGKEYIWQGPFEMATVREAVDWLTSVRTAEIAALPRDFRPDSGTCQSCEFFRRCWNAEPGAGKDPRVILYAEDPDGAKWQRRLEEAREARKRAEADEDDAKAALMALSPDLGTGDHADVAVPGTETLIRFTRKRGRSRLDEDQIAADYARVGAVPPRTRGEPTVSISFIAPEAAGDEVAQARARDRTGPQS